MKLYFTPGACSLAPHIVALEAGVPLETEAVDLATHKTASGKDFYAINPRGYVPALDIGEGLPLTEASVLVQYIADQKPGGTLLAPAGSMQRVRTQQWLAWISTELHKGFGPLWNPATPQAVRDATVANLKKKFAELDSHLASRPFIMGDAFSVADAYAYVIMRWTVYHKVDISNLANLAAFAKRVEARPSVQTALAAESVPAIAA